MASSAIGIGMAIGDALPGTADGPAPPNDLIQLSVVELCAAAALLLINALISLHLKLGTEQALLVAGVRCVAQLSALGYILKPIFQAQKWWLVLGYVCFMIYISAVEAMGRPRFTYRYASGRCQHPMPLGPETQGV